MTSLSPGLETAIVTAIVAVAALHLAWRIGRFLRRASASAPEGPGTGCGGGCACPGTVDSPERRVP